jgi:hypothetical protein
VILPGEDVDAVVRTLESVVAAAPKAPVHLARTGMPALDAVTDLLAGAGISIVDIPATDGLPAVQETLDATFGSDPWFHLFAGETIDRHDGAALGQGSQLRSEQRHRWLAQSTILSDPRVRRAGAPIEQRRTIVLPPLWVGGNWRYCLLADTRGTFAALCEVYEDVCLLAELGELDGAFQRAELAWRGATGPERLQLTRASTMLATVMGITGGALQAAAEWFALEPVSYAAIAFIRLASGHVPFGLLERLAETVPEDGPITYDHDRLMESYESVLEIKSRLARLRVITTARHDLLLRTIESGLGTDADVGGAFETAGLLGVDPAVVVRKLVTRFDADPPVTIGDCISANLEAAFLADTVVALLEVFGPGPLVDRVVDRLLNLRDLDLAFALDDVGCDQLDHWRRVASLDWLDAGRRAVALERVGSSVEQLDPVLTLGGPRQTGSNSTDALVPGGDW